MRAPRKRSPFWRTAAVSLGLIAGGVLVALALVAIWADTLLLDRDRYVDAVAPLAGDSDVQAAIATVVSDAISSRVAPPIGGNATRSLIEGAVRAVVSSGAFQSLWTDANRIAHAQVVALLTGADTDLLQARDGEIYLELGPIVQAATEDLDVLGLDISSAAAAAADTEFPILTTTEIAPVQRWVRLLDDAAFWFPLAAVVALALAFWVSVDRWRTTVAIGLALVASGLLVLLAAVIARTIYLNETADAVPDTVAQRLFDRLVDPLQTSVYVLMTLAGILILTGIAGGIVAPRVRRPHP